MAWIARLLLLPIAAALLATSGPAHADYPLRGGPGGGPFRSECPPNTYMTGLYGRTGEWVDQIGILCAPFDFNANRFLGGNAVQPPHGGQTGGGQQPQCPPGQAVTGFKLYIHPNPEFHNHNSPNYHASPLYLRGVLASCGVPAAPNASSFCFGKCSDADTGTFLGSELPKMKTYSQNCAAEGLMMTGINGRGGSYVDAMGGFCGPNPTPPPPVAAAPPPPPPAPVKPIKTTGKAKGGGSGPAAPPGLLFCRTGGAMKPFGNPSNDGSMLVTFEAAPQPANVALPGPGQCAWDVQVVSPTQAKRLGLGSVAMGTLGDIQSDKVFKVHASAMTAFLFASKDLEIVSDAIAAAQATVGGGEGAGASAEAGGQGNGGGDGGGGDGGGGDGGGGGGGGGMAGGIGMPSGDCPAGPAVVQTPPGLDFLNVRPGPSTGSPPVAQVPNGSQVTVSGSCIDAAKGAGFARQTLAPKGQGGGGMAAGGGDGPWCRIEAPDPGCVKAEFLVFGNGGGGGIDPAKGAGFAAQKPKGKGLSQGKGQGEGLAQGQAGGGGFGGHWSADADGVSYDLRLQQVGSVVKGSFTATDGSKGTILGNLNGKTLRFAWVQTNDGQTGSGKFLLDPSGASFSGTYNFQVGNFDKVEGQWNGKRM